MIHKPVLLNETIENLNLKPGDTYFDGTLGGAGHSEKVCSDFDKKVKVIAVDRDIDAINHAKEKLSKIGCEYKLVLSDYRKMDTVFENLGIKKVDAIMFDLGLSSDQLDLSGRGFSFKKNEPLLMTFASDTEKKITARDILNNWGEETIADILYGYADERYARRIAKAVVESRKKKKIETTYDFLEVIKKAVPKTYQFGKIHYATKSFQGLRIAVNDEIEALKEGLRKGWDYLNTGGRMAVISFHSTEDREVKNYFRERSKQKEGKLINKKPIIPTKEEMEQNPRSRSAKLRIIEKI